MGIMSSSGSGFRAGKKNGSTSDGPFSARSAFLTTAVLTAVLCWLPVFGQMVAGYVGGRRSGSAAKGVLVSCSVMGIFVILVLLIAAVGYTVTDMQELLSGTVLSGVPAFSEFSTSLFDYVRSMFSSFGTDGSACAVMALTTVVFAMAGGMVAGQVRAEKEYLAPSGTVAVAGSSARSVDSYRSGRSPGFGSFDEYSPVHAMQTNTVTGSSSARPAVRAAPVREDPQPMEARSPLSSVLQISDRSVQPRERPVAAKEDFEYI